MYECAFSNLDDPYFEIFCVDVGVDLNNKPDCVFEAEINTSVETWDVDDSSM